MVLATARGSAVKRRCPEPSPASRRASKPGLEERGSSVRQLLDDRRIEVDTNHLVVPGEARSGHRAKVPEAKHHDRGIGRSG